MSKRDAFLKNRFMISSSLNLIFAAYMIITINLRTIGSDTEGAAALFLKAVDRPHIYSDLRRGKSYRFGKIIHDFLRSCIYFFNCNTKACRM